jgi:DNA-binding MarR family transcriptional regulator
MTEISTIRMPAGFEREFPGASRSASEVAVNLARAQLALITEVERPAREAHGLSASAFQVLAILDGAGEPLPGHVIAERLLVSSASMTSLVDTLERRGLVERHPHPTDRRKVLIYLTADAQRIADQQLPALHAVLAQAISTLAEDDREHLLTSLTTIRARVSQIASQPLPPANARRGVSSQRPGAGPDQALPEQAATISSRENDRSRAQEAP